MAFVPSGRQFEITHGEQRAIIVEVGGGVRVYEAGSSPVLDPFPIDAMCDGAHGMVLVPWPNRLADGRYRFAGNDYQVALTEPEKSNAIHGFLRWRAFESREHSTDHVVMAAKIFPLAGYPFALEIEVDYRLSDEGLTVTTSSKNVGDVACPYGAGQHPYLSPGDDELIDSCVLELKAATRILTDNDRQLPSGTEPTATSRLNFVDGRLLGDEKIDFPFCDLTRDALGRAWVKLTRPDGRRVELWVDEHYPIIEIYTGDTLAPARQRKGLGTEPMTCPPNAFQTGDRLVTLEPGETLSMSWGVQLREDSGR